jgi:hypothetical protein
MRYASARIGSSVFALGGGALTCVVSSQLTARPDS